MGKNALSASIAAFFGLFLVIPIACVVLMAFTGKPLPVIERVSSLQITRLIGEVAENASTRYIEDLTRVKRYRKAAVNSIVLAVTVATLASLLALPLSLGFSRGLFGAPRIFEVLLMMPMVTPIFLYAFALLLIFSKYGIIAKMFGISIFDPFSFTGLVVTQVTGLLPLAVLAQTPSFSLYSRSWSTVAEGLGADGTFSTWRVWLPLNSTGILTGWVLVVLRSLGDFVTPMLLTSARFRLLVLEAWRDMAGSSWWPGAAALCSELLLLALILLAWERRLLAKERAMAPLSPMQSLGESTEGVLARWGVTAYALVVLSIPVLAAVLVALSSFGVPGDAGFTFAHYAQVFKEAPAAIVNSLILGVSVVVFGVIGSLIVAKTSEKGSLKESISAMALIGFAVPTTAYAIGLMGVFNEPPLVLHFTPTLVVISILVTRFNYGLRLIEGSYGKLGCNWEDASKTMGATSDFIFRWVNFPYLKPAIGAAAVLMGISALQDVALTVLIAPPRFYPLSLVTARYIADGLFAPAAAMGTILMAVLLILAASGLKGSSFSRQAEF